MSLLGTLLRPKHLPSATKVTGCPRASRKRSSDLVHNPEYALAGHRSVNNIRRAARQWEENDASKVEDVFIGALVQASTCSACSVQPKSYGRALRGATKVSGRLGKQPTTNSQQARLFSTSVRTSQVATEAREREEEVNYTEKSQESIQALGSHISRQRYEDLANTYNSPPGFWQKLMNPSSPPRLAKSKPGHVSLAPRLVITPEQESKHPYSERYVLPPEDEDHAEQLDRLKRLLKQGGRFAPIRKQVWKVYKSLRSPRPRYLSDKDMRRVLRNLSWVQFKTLDNSRDFFSVLDECIAEGVALTAEHWNTAISFAGRWTKQVGTDEVKAAVETWMRMENHGVAADHVTFNVLFDVAIRAGRFALADTIYEELKARDFPLNRYFHTSMIYYAGLRRNGDAVRQAFRQLVHAGEIIDTAVMNCVIRSLVRAGEPASAWDVFQKMKELHAAKFGTSSAKNWVERKQQWKDLDNIGRKLRKAREAHEASFFGSLYSTEKQKEEAQRAAPIHPDNHTCGILIRHHALISGNYEAVKLLLQDLADGGWKLHGSVYHDLFGGFRLHGGVPGTRWKRDHLERFWQDFQDSLGSPPKAAPDAIDDGQGPSYTPFGAKAIETIELDPEPGNEELAPYYTSQLAIVILKAFYACAGLPRALEVWQRIQDQWVEMTSDEQMRVQDVVDGFKGEASMYLP